MLLTARVVLVSIYLCAVIMIDPFGFVCSSEQEMLANVGLTSIAFQKAVMKHQANPELMQSVMMLQVQLILPGVFC